MGGGRHRGPSYKRKINERNKRGPYERQERQRERVEGWREMKEGARE